MLSLSPAPVNDIYVVNLSGASNVNASHGLLGEYAGSSVTAQAGTSSGANGGSFTFNADGSFSYAPGPKSSQLGYDRASYTVEDKAGDTGSATVTVLSQPAGVIWKFYESVLNRSPDDQGLQFWVGDFANGGTPGDISVQFFESDELLNKILGNYYQQYLQRPLDANGLTYWKGVWHATGGPEQIKAGFADSPEFYKSAGAAPDSWIDALYRRILNRTPDSSGKSFWLNYYQQQTAAGMDAGTVRYNIAMGFFTSAEAFGDDITGWFQQYLQRVPTASELAQYQQQMLSGASDRTIEQEITNTAEYSQNPPAPPSGSGVPLPSYYVATAQNGQVAPHVITQPTDQVPDAKDSVTFVATASGAPVPTVQWQSSSDAGQTWQDVAGATKTSLTVKSVTPAMNGIEYRAEFTNVAGTADSNSASIKANEALLITLQPVPQTTLAGRQATFTAEASDSTATAQWQESADGGHTWSNVAGATSPTLTLTAQSSNVGHQFRVVFTNSAGSVTSQAAALTLDTPPTVTTQPTDQAPDTSGSATFSAAADGTPTPSVQWQSSTNGGQTWSNVQGATNTTLIVNGVTSSQDGTEYRAVFSNPAGTIQSMAATLNVGSAPVVTTQPKDQVADANNAAQFTAAADGTPVPSVQWQSSADGGQTWSDVPGATSATLSLSTITSSMDGTQYRAVFTNSAGSVTTQAATLGVATSLDQAAINDYQQGSSLVQVADELWNTLTTNLGDLAQALSAADPNLNDVVGALYAVDASVADVAQAVWTNFPVTFHLVDLSGALAAVDQNLGDVVSALYSVDSSLADVAQAVWNNFPVTFHLVDLSGALGEVDQHLSDVVTALYSVDNSVTDVAQAVWNNFPITFHLGDLSGALAAVDPSLGDVVSGLYAVDKSLTDVAQAVWNNFPTTFHLVDLSGALAAVDQTLGDVVSALYSVDNNVTDVAQAVWNNFPVTFHLVDLSGALAAVDPNLIDVVGALYSVDNNVADVAQAVWNNFPVTFHLGDLVQALDSVDQSPGDLVMGLSLVDPNVADVVDALDLVDKSLPDLAQAVWDAWNGNTSFTIQDLANALYALDPSLGDLVSAIGPLSNINVADVVDVLSAIDDSGSFADEVSAIFSAITDYFGSSAIDDVVAELAADYGVDGGVIDVIVGIASA